MTRLLRLKVKSSDGRLGQAGFTLLSSLLAIVILSIVVVAVMGMAGDMMTIYSRQEMMNKVGEKQMAVAALLQNQDSCDKALFSGATKFLFPLPPNTSPQSLAFTRVLAPDGATAVVQTGTAIRGNLKVSALTFQEFNPTVRGKISVRKYNAGTNAYDITDYLTYEGNLVISFAFDQANTGGNPLKFRIPDRRVPLSIAVNAATNSVDRCYYDASAEHICAKAMGTYNATTQTCDGIPNFASPTLLTAVDCSAQAASLICPSPAPTCNPGKVLTPLYLLAGMTRDFRPKCKCSYTCN